MNNTIAINTLPKEVLFHELIFPKCQFKEIVTFSRTSTSNYEEFIKGVEGLFDRSVTTFFPHTEFLRFIDGYRKMIREFKEADNFFEKVRGLFANYYLSSNFLSRKGLIHNEILSLDYNKFKDDHTSNPTQTLSISLNRALKSTEDLEDEIFLRLMLVIPKCLAGFVDGLITAAFIFYGMLKGYCNVEPSSYCHDLLDKIIDAQKMNGDIHEDARIFCAIIGMLVGLAIGIVCAILLLDYFLYH